MQRDRSADPAAALRTALAEPPSRVVKEEIVATCDIRRSARLLVRIGAILACAELVDWALRSPIANAHSCMTPTSGRRDCY